MRYALAAIVLIATPAFAAGGLSPADLTAAWQAANSNCQGSADPEGYEAKAACQKRDRLSGRLTERGYCFGLKSQPASQYRWHHCTPASNREDDAAGL